MSTRADFVGRARARLLDRYPEARVLDDDTALLVDLPGQAAMLHVFSSTQDEAEWVRTLPEPDDALDLRTHLIVLLRPDSLRAALLHGDREIPWIRQFPGLSTLLVCDQGRSLRFVDRALLDRHGLDAESAFQIALENTWRTLESRIHRVGEGVQELTCSGILETSLLVCDPLWDAIADELGPVTVAVPSRSCVLLARRDRTEAQAALDQRLLTALAAPDLLLPFVYERWGGAWVLSRRPSTAVSAYAARMVTVREMRAQRGRIEEVATEVVPGLFQVIQAKDAATPPGQVTDAELEALEAERGARMRPELTQEADGLLSLTDRGGSAADLVHSAVFEQLAPHRLIGLPSRDVVLLAPPELAEKLRQRVAAIHGAAGTEALSRHIFSFTDQGLQFWPSSHTCERCTSLNAPGARFCWNCGHSVCEPLLWRWTWESVLPTALIVGPFWLVGGVQHWFFTTWMIWGEVYVLGWVLRARWDGYSTAQALGAWLASVYRWMVVFAPVICLVRLPSWIELLLLGPGYSVSGVLGWGMQLLSVPLLAGLFVATVRVLGWEAVDPRNPYPPT